MKTAPRSVAFWIFVVFLVFELAFFLVGQTLSLFSYDLSVRLGLQESAEEVSAYGVQLNRSFAVADTLVGVPLMVLSLIGLVLRKPWALATLAAFLGLSLYWPICCSGLLLLLPGVEGFNLVPGISYWITFAIHVLFGIWGLVYIGFRGQTLVAR